MSIFRGAGVAIVTPMKDNYEVNYDAQDTNINYQIDNGTDCIVLFYRDFSTTFRYMPLGRLEDPSGLAQAAGRGAARVTAELTE